MAKSLFDGQAKRGNTFTLEPNHPAIVIVGVDRQDLYGGPGDPKLLSHPLYDERAFLGPETRRELRGLLEELGFLHAHPVSLWRDGDLFLVEDGRQRLLESRDLMAERGSFPVTFVVSAGEEVEAFMHKVAGNAGRRDWTIMEKARLTHEALTRWKIDPKKVQRIFGYAGTSAMNRRDRLVELHADLMPLVDTLVIPATTAEELAKLPRGAQIAKWEELKAIGATTRETQREVLREERQTREGKANGRAKGDGEDDGEGAEKTPREVSPGLSRATMKKLIAALQAEKVAVPGGERLAFADVLRVVTGDLAVNKVGGLLDALREVDPNRYPHPSKAKAGKGAGA